MQPQLSGLRNVCLALLIVTLSSHAATVELNVVAGPRAPFDGIQKWALELGKLRSVQVRAGGKTSATRPEVKRVGTTISITGIVDGGNRLVLPGKSFTIRQRAEIQRWIDSQKNAKSGTAKGNDRFGLTNEDLKLAHKQLKATYDASTKDKLVSDVVRTAARVSRLPLRFFGNARSRMASAKVQTEWKGFTTGTVIAAALRPLELVMVPRTSKGELELIVASDKAVEEGWPVGWKSKLRPSELVPKYYDSAPIEIQNTAVADITKAIEARLATPIQYDRALFELVELDPAKKQVSFKDDRASYYIVLRKTMFKAGIKEQIRVDERGKPFFWLSPRKLPK